jgi:hypothetical protein
MIIFSYQAVGKTKYIFNWKVSVYDDLSENENDIELID